MSEQDPIPTEVVETPETVEIVTTIIQVNRPRKVYSGMWGPAEIGAVAVSGLAIIAALVVYFFFVVPSNRELARNRSEADRLEAEQLSAKSKYGEITSSEAQVGKLLTSVDDFQTRFLPVSSNGQAALYQRLNGLIAAYGLVNTTGPDYAPLETADINPNQKTDEERGRAKFRSLFPGVYVTVTLEGSYQNLRRFIREIETGREFIVVSSVELAPADTEKKKDNTKPDPSQIAGGLKPTGVPGQPQAPLPVSQSNKGKMRGETVSLHLEMAAYFRRADFTPMPAAPSGQ